MPRSETVEVDARCANASTAFPFGVDECRQLVGQRARLIGPNLDRSRTFGFVTVRSAALVGDEIALRLSLESPYSGVLASTDDKPVRVCIGYERRVPGDDIVLREVSPDPGPPAVPITHEPEPLSGVIASKPAPLTPIVQTEEECLGHGGHCFERLDYVLPSDPPQFPEKCKHCPATRVAIPRTPFYYRYPDGSVDASTRG